jgi:hypothetical protein
LVAAARSDLAAVAKDTPRGLLLGDPSALATIAVGLPLWLGKEPLTLHKFPRTTPLLNANVTAAAFLPGLQLQVTAFEGNNSTTATADEVVQQVEVVDLQRNSVRILECKQPAHKPTFESTQNR